MQAKDRSTSPSSAPWNKGKIVGQKRPFKLQEVWAIRIRRQLASRIRDYATESFGLGQKIIIQVDRSSHKRNLIRASHGVILDGWRWFVMGSGRIFQGDVTSGAPSPYLTFVSSCSYASPPHHFCRSPMPTATRQRKQSFTSRLGTGNIGYISASSGQRPFIKSRHWTV